MRIPRTTRLAAILLLAPFLMPREAPGAAPIVVFGEKDVYAVDAASATAGPRDPDRAAFFSAYRADVGRGAPLERSLDLVSPPPWGKTVSESTRGRIQFHPSFPGGFACRIALEGLPPAHGYILTLNGNPSRAGNGLLSSAVPGNELERYYDFLIITTDSRGRYEANLGVFLKPGKYDVRCYVKDTADFKIVLYRDFFTFEVR